MLAEGEHRHLVAHSPLEPFGGDRFRHLLNLMQRTIINHDLQGVLGSVLSSWLVVTSGGASNMVPVSGLIAGGRVARVKGSRVHLDLTDVSVKLLGGSSVAVGEEVSLDLGALLSLEESLESNED